MSRSSQHNELRRRHGTTDYRLFAPEQYEFPERIEATEAIFDESLGFTFLNRPYLRSNNDREKWLLASMHAHCDPSQWKKGASIANTKAAYSIWFGRTSKHNFTSLVHLSDRNLNPLHKAETDGLYALLAYLKERKRDLLRRIPLGKIIVMCDNINVIEVFTNNVRRWRETKPSFWNPQTNSEISNSEKIQELDSLMQSFESTGCQIELWYKAVDGNWAARTCLAAISRDPVGK